MFEHGDETMERRLEGKWYISREIEESEISLSIIFEKIENLFFFFGKTTLSEVNDKIKLEFEFVSNRFNGYDINKGLCNCSYNIERKNSSTDMIHTTYSVLSKHNIQMTHYC